MKITLEIPDPRPTPESATTSASAKTTPIPAKASQVDVSPDPPAGTPKPPVATAEPKVTQRTAEKRDAVPQRARVETQPKVSEGKPSQPELSNMHSFDQQGGVNVIDDPRKGQSGFYQFVQPKGEA